MNIKTRKSNKCRCFRRSIKNISN